MHPGGGGEGRKTKANCRVITPNVEMNPDVPKIGLCDVARSRDAIRKQGLCRLSAELMRSAAVESVPLSVSDDVVFCFFASS